MRRSSPTCTGTTSGASWHRAAREMFPALDVQAWRESGHNPLRMLAMLPEETLQAAARNSDFLERYDAVMDEFEAEVGTQTGWFTSEHGKGNAPLAYFSAEYHLPGYWHKRNMFEHWHFRR